MRPSSRATITLRTVLAIRKKVCNTSRNASLPVLLLVSPAQWNSRSHQNLRGESHAQDRKQHLPEPLVHAELLARLQRWKQLQVRVVQLLRSRLDLHLGQSPSIGHKERPRAVRLGNVLLSANVSPLDAYQVDHLLLQHGRVPMVSRVTQCRAALTMASPSLCAYARHDPVSEHRAML